MEEEEPKLLSNHLVVNVDNNLLTFLRPFFQKEVIPSEMNNHTIMNKNTESYMVFFTYKETVFSISRLRKWKRINDERVLIQVVIVKMINQSLTNDTLISDINDESSTNVYGILGIDDPITDRESAIVSCAEKIRRAWVSNQPIRNIVSGGLVQKKHRKTQTRKKRCKRCSRIKKRKTRKI